MQLNLFLFDDKFYMIICLEVCCINFDLFQVYIYMNYLKVVMSIFQNQLCHPG